MEQKIVIRDHHSFSKPEEVLITHTFIDIVVDFNHKIIKGKVAHNISNKTDCNKIILDCKDIIVEKITIG